MLSILIALGAIEFYSSDRVSDVADLVKVTGIQMQAAEEREL